VLKPYLTYEPFGKEYIVCAVPIKVTMTNRNGVFHLTRCDNIHWRRCVYSIQEGLDIMRSIVGDFHIPAGVKV
jgi:hypothetical protein